MYKAITPHNRASLSNILLDCAKLCSVSPRCFNEEACVSIPAVEGYVMVLQPEEPKISLSGINHFARSASEFESSEGVSLFPELRIISTITREVEPEGDGDEDPTGTILLCVGLLLSLSPPRDHIRGSSFCTEAQISLLIQKVAGEKKLCMSCEKV